MTLTPLPGGGLYAVTPSTPLNPDRQVEQAILGGATVIQYRAKQLDGRIKRQQATAVLIICRRHRVPLIINDDIELAADIGADGVHLGREDGSVAEARARLGEDAIIGVSCYNKTQNAVAAAGEGASYVAFGRFFPSRTKPMAAQAETALITTIKQTLNIPVVAIGGITPENGGSLIAAGADFLAVVDGIFGQPDPCSAASRYRSLFECPEKSPGHRCVS